jgi:hypothetical protein
MHAGATLLSGVAITLTAEPNGKPVDVAVSDSEGRFRFSGLKPGAYGLRAALAGFQEIVRRGLSLMGDEDLEVNLDIALAVTEHVDAVVKPDQAPMTAASQETIAGKMIDIAPVKGDDFQALLPMLPGVLRGPDGRINMKGGRPTQTGLQMSQAYLNDPATGNAGFDLPVDAIGSIDVLPNPYTAEYGRFSSGLTKIETRPGTDRWQTSATNFIPAPCLKLCDERSLGIRAYDPRLSVSGPLIKDRLFLSESVQFHDHKEYIPSLPRSSDDITATSLTAFTRLDAHLSTDHQITGTVALFLRNVDFANLNTFNPQPVTPSFLQDGYNVGLVDTVRLFDTALLETTVNFKRYDATIGGHGSADMIIAPGGNSGNFFNHQSRRTSTVQGIESFQVVRHWAGDHLLKVGIDALNLSFDGTSESQTVDVLREDGTLDQRIDFNGPTAQHVETTDIGAFVQDGWRWNDRVLLEFGARIDRDGVIQRTNASPRLGAVVAVLPDGRGILRGGTGRFYERTPLLVGAFEQLETRTVTQFAVDGVTPLGSPIQFVNRFDGRLETPSSRVWNVEYDHRLTSTVLLKVNHLERVGTNEYLIEPLEPEASGLPGSTGSLDLSSSGRSNYRETEATLRYIGPADRQLTLTYVRSRSEGDLNSFDTFFGNFRDPIIRPDQYALTNVDVPNRLIALAVFYAGKWRVAPLIEARNGFPYSIVNQDQDFVGQRNSARFPFFYSLDLGISRPIVIRHRNARIGLKANHLLNNWAPRDVQANIASPSFGTFYNSIVPRFNLSVELRP